MDVMKVAATGHRLLEVINRTSGARQWRALALCILDTAWPRTDLTPSDIADLHNWATAVEQMSRE